MSRYVPSLLHSKLQHSEHTSWQCQRCIVGLHYSCAKPAHGHKGSSQTVMLTSWLHCMHTHTKPALLFFNKNRRDAWCSRCRSVAACKTGCIICMEHEKCRSERKPTCDLDSIKCQAVHIQLLLKQKAGVSQRVAFPRAQRSNRRQTTSQANHQLFLAYRVGYEEAHTRVCSPLGHRISCIKRMNRRKHTQEFAPPW